MGEQVAGAPGYGWFDGVRADLAGENYASRCVDIPACAVDAPTSASGSTGSPWTTPSATDHANRSRRYAQGGSPLTWQMQPASWVTPSARDWKDSAGMSTSAEDGRTRLDQLPRQMTAAWPTPDASLGGPDPLTRKTGLSTQTYMAGAGMAPSGPAPNGSSATTAKRGAPSPAFACWLMGWPDAFRRGVLRAIQLLPRSPRK